MPQHVQLELTIPGEMRGRRLDQALAELVKALCKHYPSLTTKRVAGHSDIAPGRKTDPGSGFNWDKLSSFMA